MPLNEKLILPREMGKLGAMEIVSGSKNPVLKSEYCNSAFLVIKAKSKQTVCSGPKHLETKSLTSANKRL